MLSLSPITRAEDTAGSAAVIRRDIDLRKEASPDAESLGRLPKGTIITLQGEKRGDYVFISVELQKGGTAEGWVRNDAVSRSGGDEPSKKRGGDEDDADKKAKEDFQDDDGETERQPRPRSKITIPRDEGVLLRRDPSFFYGLSAGGNYGVVTLSGSSALYTGFGFTAGGYLGLYLDTSLPLDVEVDYTSINVSANVSDSSLPSSIGFGFVDTAAKIHYVIDHFDFFGGIQYSFGISVSGLPSTFTVTPQSLSNFWILGGAGYKFSLSDSVDFVVRGKYSYCFATSPFGFQLITIAGFLEFHG